MANTLHCDDLFYVSKPLKMKLWRADKAFMPPARLFFGFTDARRAQPARTNVFVFSSK